MRPLNRPMFRYGGPIKEGIMDGIREPKKNGGAMGINKPKRGLVNEPGSYAGFLGLAPYVGAGLTALRVGASRAIPRIANFFRTQTGTTAVKKQGPSITIPGVRSQSSKGYPGPKIPERTIGPGTGEAPIYSPNFLGRDPTVRLVGGTYKAITSPQAKGIGAGAARLVFSPTGLVTGAIYAGGKFFDSDGNEIKDAAEKGLVAGDRVGTSGAPGGGDPGMFLTPQAKGSEGATLSKEELRKKNVERYRDIMDIKGMNKDAAYNSLIEASRLINESGDFKGDIKSGKLINQVIQATSKAFDKPKATKDAIDTLILKGEIEKDINATDPKSIADLAYKEAATKKLNKELKGNTTAEIIQARMLKDDMPTGSNLAGLISINNPELNIKVLPTKDLGNADPIEYMSKIVTTVNADETTPDYPAGVYVLKDKVIQITEEGAVVPVPISALK